MSDKHELPTAKCINCCNPYCKRLLWKDANHDEFIAFEKFKTGWLYACRNCMSFWYLDDAQEILTRTENVVLLREWANMDFHLPTHMKQVLADIGANPEQFYGNYKDEIEFPCRVITKDGRIYDPALIRLQKYPNFADSTHHHISEIKRIETSDYTLNPQIRYATARAEEIRMCYDPTCVGVINGPNYTLLGQNTFFQDGPYKGKDCLLGATSKDAKWVEHFDSMSARAIFVGLWEGEMALHRIGDPRLFFITRYLQQEDVPKELMHVDIIRQEILNEDKLYLIAVKNVHAIDPMLEELGLAPIHLVYDGVGFNRTIEAWNSFDKHLHAGVITLASDAKLGAADFEANIFFNLLKDIGGLHVLLGFPPEWRKEILRKYPKYIDIDSLIQATTGGNKRVPSLERIPSDNY